MNTPQRLLTLLALLLLPVAAAPRAAAQEAGPDTLKIIATVPTYGALAREIGGSHVEVTVLCRPGQDMHNVTPLPSLVERLRDAELLLFTGLDAELWLDPMLRASANIALLPGSPRAIMMSNGIPLRQIPTQADRSQGDMHAFGNPHVWTDPLALRTLAAHVKDALVAALPQHAAEIAERHERVHREITAACISWLTRYKGLQGQKVVVYHQSWTYLTGRFGLVETNAIEPKPRVPPTAGHLAQVIEQMQRDGTRVILREPWQAPEPADRVAEQVGATVVDLSTHPDPAEGLADVLAHYELMLARLAQALGVPVEPATVR